CLRWETPAARRTRLQGQAAPSRLAGCPAPILRIRDATAPRSPATSPAQYPAGSGVAVSVLLRQSRGFEGLLLSCVLSAPDDSAVTEHAEDCEANLSLDPAQSGSTRHSKKDDDPV